MKEKDFIEIDVAKCHLEDARQELSRAYCKQIKRLEKENAELLNKIEKLELRNEELEQQNAYECECNKEYAETLEKNEVLEQQLKEANDHISQLEKKVKWFEESEDSFKKIAEAWRQRYLVLESAYMLLEAKE